MRAFKCGLPIAVLLLARALKALTPTPDWSATPTSTLTPTSCGACTVTLTSTISPTPTITPDATACPACPDTYTATVTSTLTPTYCGACTATLTRTITPTPTDIGAGLPDLRPIFSTISQYPYGNACINSPALGMWVTVDNTGPAPAGPFVVDVDGSQQSLSGLAAYDNTFLWFGGIASMGNHTVTVDVLNTVAESDESNNSSTAFYPIPTLVPTCLGTYTITPTSTPTPCIGCSPTDTPTQTVYQTRTISATSTTTRTPCPACTPTVTTTVTYPPQPDLMSFVSMYSQATSGGCATGPLMAWVDVYNNGGNATGPFIVYAAGVSQTVSNLNGGEHTTVYVPVVSGAPVTFYLDSGNAVAERDETNNVISPIMAVPTPVPTCAGTYTSTPSPTGFSTPLPTLTTTASPTACGACTPSVTPTQTGFIISLTLSPTPSPWNEKTPLACSAFTDLADTTFNGPAQPAGGAGAYMGAWNGGVIEAGAGRSGSALRLDSAGGFMGYQSEAVQDICLGTACSVTVCVYARANGLVGTMGLLVEQLDANASVLSQQSQTVPASTSWTQICLSVGDGSPLAAGAVALRVHLLDPPIWSTATTVWYDDATAAPALGAGTCGGATPTKTPPPVPGGGAGSYPYPNPAKGSLQIAIQSPGSGTATIQILNSRGLLVTTIKYPVSAGLTAVPVSLLSLAHGVYFYRIRLNLDDGSVLKLPVKTFVVLK